MSECLVVCSSDCSCIEETDGLSCPDISPVPASNNEEPSTLPGDPCDGKPNCEQCKQAAENSDLNEETCYWENGNCSKVPADVYDLDKMCKSPLESDSCKPEKTCDACQKATSEIDGDDLWENEICKKVSKKDNLLVYDMCAPQRFPPVMLRGLAGNAEMRQIS